MIKSIGYAYATSAHAAKLGAGRTGCWYIETRPSETNPRTLSLDGPFDTLEQAHAAAVDMPGDWSRYSRIWSAEA